jgi:predicted TIM-barrel fold metal-dependent hydrolase
MANPARFDPFLWLPDIRPAKIVLLHGSYPYCREAGFMVGRMGVVPSLYLDLSMMIYSVPGSPQALVGIVRDWLQAGLAEKIVYGSDTTNVINTFIAAAKHT